MTAPTVAGAAASAVEPGSAAPSAPTPSTAPADPLRAWADVMAALESARALTLLGWYQHAVVLKWDDRSIELGFPAGAIAGDLAIEPHNVDALGKFLRQHLGAPVALSVRVLSEADRRATDSARSIVEAEAERRRDEVVRRKAEARDHPMTKMVLDTFGASIEEIKTDV